MPLPLHWVDKIFTKLTLVYGHEFLNRWRDIDIDAVKADWAHELDGFENHPEALGHALAHLPVKPPTVLEFREIARKCPPPVFKALPAPAASEESKAKVREMLDGLRKKMAMQKVGS